MYDVKGIDCLMIAIIRCAVNDYKKGDARKRVLIRRECLYGITGYYYGEEAINYIFDQIDKKKKPREHNYLNVTGERRSSHG